MPIIEIQDIDVPGVSPFTSLTETQLRMQEDTGLIIAESPKVIRTAIDAGLAPISLLCERKHIKGDAADIILEYPDLPVYTADRDILASITGYTLTRGVLCAMKRPERPSANDILRDAKIVCVIYDVCDTTNIGAIFRTAAALGTDGILLSPDTCDPFNRRSIRVSMGTVFQIPWCFCNDILPTLKCNGFKSVGMALSDSAVFLHDFKVESKEKYALILGSEGYGLPEGVIDSSDYVVKIPMHHGVDSLNVGAAAAIAIWHFTKH